MTEPTNTEIKTLLERHMTDSSNREERAITRTSELGITVKNLADTVAKFGDRLSRVEAAREGTHNLARKAMESADELEGVVLREVTALQTSNAKQNEALEKIQASTKGIVEADAARKKAGEARDALFALLVSYSETMIKWSKGIAALLVLLAAGWAVFTFAVSQAEKRPAPALVAPAH